MGPAEHRSDLEDQVEQLSGSAPGAAAIASPASRLYSLTRPRQPGLSIVAPRASRGERVQGLLQPQQLRLRSRRASKVLIERLVAVGPRRPNSLLQKSPRRSSIGPVDRRRGV